jgi:hypothetical protein
VQFDPELTTHKVRKIFHMESEAYHNHKNDTIVLRAVGEFFNDFFHRPESSQKEGLLQVKHTRKKVKLSYRTRLPKVK